MNPQRAKQRQPANEFGSGEAPWPAHWIKLQYDTSIETFLTCATIAGLFLAAALFLDTRTTTRLGISRTPLRPLAPYALTVGLLALGARLATDNFALVDPDRHELYAHVRFLWFRRIRRVLAAGEAAAVTATGRKCWTMWSSWWEYRAVAISRARHRFVLSDWNERQLGAANSLAEEIASWLDCPFVPCPSERRLVLRREENNAHFALNFATWPWWRSRVLVTTLLVTLPLVVILVLVWWGQRSGR